MPSRFPALASAALLAAALCASCSDSPAPPPDATFRPCAADDSAFADAECGSVRVFENRATRRGRTIDIAFARWRATSGSATEALLLLAGGPGAGGGVLAGDVDGWAQPLRSTIDIVVVDQRGTGLSNALQCPTEVDAAPATSFGHLYDAAALRRCRTALEATADLRQYTTDSAADDLDEVRAALGYTRVSLYGGSYGTRLAQVYMRRFPERVRAAVLDGVLPVGAKIPLTYAAAAQQALDRIVGACAASKDCNAEHPSLAADVRRLLDRFRSEPVATFVTPPGREPVAVSMSRGDLGYALRGIMYGPDAVSALPEMLSHAAASGDVRAFAQRYWQRAFRFSRMLSTAVHLSVLCAEDVPFIRDDEIETATARTFLDRYLVDEYRRACAEWPAVRVPAAFAAPVRSSVPTLLISGYFDPVTPPAFAAEVATTLTASRQIVSPHGAHGSVAGCPREAALFLLRTGTLEGSPAVCQ